MSTRPYELMLLLSPALDEERTKSTLERISRLITEKGGTITHQEHWGMRRLAYPIKRFKEGNYFLTQCTLDTSSMQEIESTLRVTEDVMRHLLVRREE